MFGSWFQQSEVRPCKVPVLGEVMEALRQCEPDAAATSATAWEMFALQGKHHMIKSVLPMDRPVEA